MAIVQITIKDADVNNIAVDVNLQPQFPTSALLMTNAQMLGRDLIGVLQQLAKNVNDKKHQETLIDATSL